MKNRLAFIADIHSNLTALKSVLVDIEKRNIDTVICLGDIVGKGPRPNECINLVKEKCADVISGNLEVSVTKVDKNIDGTWNRSVLTKKNFEYLSNLEYNGSISIGSIKIFYTHAFSNDFYKTNIIRKTELDDMSNFDINADILVYADIHHQYVKKYPDFVVYNTGSVGNHICNEYNQIKNPNVLAEYLILEIDGKNINHEFIQVDYDKLEEINYVKKIKFPLSYKYITEITTGKYIKC